MAITVENAEQPEVQEPEQVEKEIALDLVLRVPDKNTSGFLLRMRRALAFQHDLEEGNATPETVDEMVEFLADFVKVPEDRNEARELLWHASEAEFNELLDAITDAGASPKAQSDEPSAGS